MNYQLEIVTSLFVLEGALELPMGFKIALEAHAASDLVSQIQVLTEAHLATVEKLIVGLRNQEKINVVSSNLRPTFADLFRYASGRIIEGTCVAVMNADVCFQSDDDIKRCFSSIEALSCNETNPVLALTRHDPLDNDWKLSLFQPCGLPNMLSVDCWIISSPVLLEIADSYSLGEMNCDLMANYDLVSAGCQIFNPCLDICIQHHEIVRKTNEYYVERSQLVESLDRLSNFMQTRKSLNYEHFEVLWVKASWLISGYRPDPYSNRSKKLFVRLTHQPDEYYLSRLAEVENFAARNSFDVVLLGDGPLDCLFEACKPLLLKNKRIYLIALERTFEDFIDSLIEIGYDNQACIVFSSNVMFLSDYVAQNSSLIILHDRSFSDSYPEAKIRRNCTLITSVYKSDQFLESFILNSLNLENYQQAVEHHFLVSDVSSHERLVLIRHFESCCNVLIVKNSLDPGLYACWNQAISFSTTEYVSNANVDDLRACDHISKLTRVLDQNCQIGVVCSATVPFYQYTGDIAALALSTSWFSDLGGEFGYFDLGELVDEEEVGTKLKPRNLPHCMPVWRRSLHNDQGFFDEPRYGTYADWAFWLATAKNGNRGYLLPEPLSFYYVNPDSHNRRGVMLDEYHRRIEDENLPLFLVYRASLQARKKSTSFSSVGLETGMIDKKFNLGFTELHYGSHRNSFSMLIESLRPLHLGEGGIKFLPFIERYFCWGSSDHEAKSKNPRPIKRSWVGIIHVPFDSPEWFAGIQRPEFIFETDLWKDSLSSCRGLICLSEDLQADLNVWYPDLATLAVKHPTDLEARRFDFRRYSRKPRVVQAGDWLRQLQAIYRIKASGHEKIMLRKRGTIKSLEREIKEMGDFSDDSVSVKDFVSNRDYDEILSSSVVLCLLYATAANNLVLECIARYTPIIINPLPSVVEYLGEDYPLYASTIEMADFLLLDRNLIFAASEYLRERVKAVDFSYRGFREGIANSSFYARL